PGHDTVPCVGSIKPATKRSAVDLPQPDGPSRETNSPGLRSRSKRSSATTPLAKVLLTPRSETETSPPGRGSTAAMDCFQCTRLGGGGGALAGVLLPLPQVLAVEYALRLRDFRPVIDRQPKPLEVAAPRFLRMVLEMRAPMQHRTVVEDLKVARL